MWRESQQIARGSDGLMLENGIHFPYNHLQRLKLHCVKFGRCVFLNLSWNLCRRCSPFGWNRYQQSTYMILPNNQDIWALIKFRMRSITKLSICRRTAIWSLQHRIWCPVASVLRRGEVTKYYTEAEKMCYWKRIKERQSARPRIMPRSTMASGHPSRVVSDAWAVFSLKLKCYIQFVAGPK